jgi:hypothetical protein
MGRDRPEIAVGFLNLLASEMSEQDRASNYHKCFGCLGTRTDRPKWKARPTIDKMVPAHRPQAFPRLDVTDLIPSVLCLELRS